VLRSSLRDNDVGCRIGGEEFMVLLPHTDAAGAAQLDARFRAQLLARSTAELGWPVNFSTGLAMCDLTDADPLARATHAADEALYEAKRLGRGRLSAAPDATPAHPTAQQTMHTATPP
jgi:diguanylate cyclase (GGDEF)-like protein